MIYQKRQGVPKRRLDADSFCEKEMFDFCEHSKFLADKENKESYSKEKSEYVVKVKKHRKKRRAITFLTLFSAIVFFVFSGFSKTDFVEGAFQKVYSLFSFHDGAKHEQSVSFPDYTEKRTIYTLTFAEDQNFPNGDEVLEEYAPSENVSDTNDKEISQTLAVVSQSAPASSSDGIKYFPITALDLSCENPLTLSNATSFDVKADSLLQNVPKSLENLTVSSQPLVLILHTHACECYSEYTTSYPENEATRCDDTDKNVVRVGKEIAQTLSDFGIASVHCEKLHDKESFINAYVESAKSVSEYLEKYPSIKFVIDVHRDAIIHEDGESVKALCNIAGEDYAQIMFVVGTNELGHNHPNWRENLTLATALQDRISSSYPSLCRSINLRNVPFNQQLLDGYLLLEVGTSANTLSEALRSARAFGVELARLIYEYDVGA